jgi:hypothetical protein
MKGPSMLEKDDMAEPDFEDVGVALGVVLFSPVFLGSRVVSLRCS